MKKILIPVVGITFVGGAIFLQDNVSQNDSIQNIAKVATAGHLHSEHSHSHGANQQWQMEADISGQAQQLPDEVLVENIQTELDAFDHLNSGEKLSIYIPQEQQDYVGTVEQSYQQFGGQVKVSSGSIENGRQFSSFTVTKGAELTLVMVATGEKIYQIEIDNNTGAGTVIDDQSLDYFRKHDDGHATPPEGIS